MQNDLLIDAHVFIDGTLGKVRLSHPEGIAIAADGSIWCGGDRGEIYRIELFKIQYIKERVFIVFSLVYNIYKCRCEYYVYIL